MRYLSILSILLIVNASTNAQLLNSIMREAQRKLEQKVAEKIVDAVSDEIAKRAFRPIEASMDSMMRRSYQDSVSQGKEVNWKKAGKAYGEFLQGMNEAVDLPDSYQFDIRQEVTLTQYDKKNVDMTLYYSTQDAITGIETHDERSPEVTQCIVMDVPRDAMILYSQDKKGHKTAQTFAHVSRLALRMAGAVTDSTGRMDNYTYSKTGKTKRVAGYTCDEYKMTSPDMEMLLYVTKAFPVKYNQQSLAYMGRVAPADYSLAGQHKQDGGLLLEYIAIQLKEKQQESRWTTVSIGTHSRSIINAEYTFGDGMNKK